MLRIFGNLSPRIYIQRFDSKGIPNLNILSEAPTMILILQIANARNHREREIFKASIFGWVRGRFRISGTRSVWIRNTPAEFGILQARTFLKFIAIKAQLQNEIWIRVELFHAQAAKRFAFCIILPSLTLKSHKYYLFGILTWITSSSAFDRERGRKKMLIPFCSLCWGNKFSNIL